MFRKSVKISLILIYLVIIAGAVVRMTGSGMGCPDWPKCFGYYIPPTEEEQLQWHANQDYFEGQVIIVDETLKVAKQKFKSSKLYNPDNWNSYEKHDYATFNAAHTWVEYINRLLGALSGVSILIMTILSIKQRKKSFKIPLFSIITLILLLFQAWLGATVVYSVLSPVRITLHMLVALIIVALLMYVLKISTNSKPKYNTTNSFHYLILLAVLLSLIQVAFGTQVRQFVDEQVKIFGYSAKAMWLKDPDTMFYIHRSFSILVLIVNLAIVYINQKQGLGFKLVKWMIGLIIFEIFTGILMFYLDFPFLSQPLHLVIAALLFGVQFYILLQSFEAKSIKTHTKIKR